MKKLTVVRAQFPVDPGTMIFNNLVNFKTYYVGYTEDDEWFNNPCFVYAEIKKLLPDSISNRFVRRPYSPVSFVALKDVEKALENADVLNYAELYSFISYQCAKFAKRAEKRLTVSVWETLPALPINFLPPYSLNVKTTRSYADIFIAHTHRAANYLKSLSVPRGKIKVVHPGIDLEKFSPMKKNSGDRFRVLFVGRFDGEKGLPLLLHAFARLFKEDPSIELWIRAKRRTGRVEDLAYMYAWRYPIKFLNYVDYDKLPEIYQQCDVLCLPSIDRYKWGIKIWEEQFGFVLMEALACGLPVVATNCGSIPEVIGPENLIVRQKSVDDLYYALKKIKRDRDYCERVSKLNRARAEECFDIEKQKRRLANILCKLAD